jgi:H+-transporting ATPase
VAAVLGIAGVTSTFLLLALAVGPLHIAGGELQTLLYLKLSVAGHFVIFLTRTEGPFWKSRPANVLLLSVLGTQLVASMLALMGWLVPQVPPLWIVGIWGYAALEVLLVDQAKQWAYRRWDRPDGPRRSGPLPVASGGLPWRWFVHPRHRGNPSWAAPAAPPPRP